MRQFCDQAFHGMNVLASQRDCLNGYEIGVTKIINFIKALSQLAYEFDMNNFKVCNVPLRSLISPTANKEETYR